MALDFFAGCLGGCAGVIVGHPLDTVKVHLQLQNSNNPKFNGTIHCFKTLLAKEGIRGVYRGVTSPLLGVAGINAIVFGVYGATQKQLRHPEALYSVAFAGATAGFVQSFFCSPMELAKSRMQVAECSRGPWECLRKIHAREGVKGVFRGQGITIAREVPAFGSYFLTYEWLTRTERDRPVSTATMLTAGGIAGMVSWAIVYPVDVIKTRMQLDGMPTTNYKSSWDCLQKSIATEGYLFLFRGLTPTLLRAFPVNAVTFAVVTWTIRILNKEGLSETVRETESIWERCTDAVYTLKMTDGASV